MTAAGWAGTIAGPTRDPTPPPTAGPRRGDRVTHFQGEFLGTMGLILPGDGVVAGEFLGAFTGAVLVWLHYLPHWAETADPAAKLGVFCTAPAVRNPAANVVSEAIGTFVLVFVGAAIVEKVFGSALLAPMAAALV